MKKLVIAILLLLLCFLGFVYIMIPNKMSVEKYVRLGANAKGLRRNLNENINWLKWWPGPAETASENQTLGYNGFHYYTRDKLVSSFTITAFGKQVIMETSMVIIPINTDSTEIVWKGEMKMSTHPIYRIQQYFSFKQMRKDIEKLLADMQTYYSQTANVYNLNIYRTTVKDSTLVSTFGISKGYPSTAYIYELIDEIKKYAQTHSATQTGAPMLNIYTADSMEYTVRVALPVDKKLPTSGNISYKWMLGGGNILLAEVKGGTTTANNALRQVENYVTDYELISPAIPFQSLNTNRLEEADTTKWVTTIYYPVMWFKSNPQTQ